MANTYYDSDLTGEQIEQALEAIDGVIVPANNGKVLAINNGKIEARSVQWDADLGPKSITENGTYNPASDNLDGYSQVTVNVSGGGGTTDANDVTYDSSETYDSGTVGAALNEHRNTLNHKADVIYDTASGDIASFPDGADGLPVKDLTVAIEPVQDLHGYENPWPAGGGKNKLDWDNIVWTYGEAIGADGSIVTNSGWKHSDYQPINGSTAYAFSVTYSKNAQAGCSFAFYDTNKGFLERIAIVQGPVTAGRVSGTFTSPANAKFYIINTSNESSVVVSDGQLELGSSATTYEPYSNICPISGWTGCNISHSGADTSDPTVIPISWQTEAGTVYGGTLDVTSGVLTVDRAKTTVGALTWTYSSTTHQFASKFPALGVFPTRSLHIFSDCFKSLFNSEPYDSTWDNVIYNVNGNFQLYIQTYSVSEVSDFLSAYGDSEIVYPLATPLVIQLDPVTVTTLLGQNNIWADTGAVLNCEYPCDTKLYIERLTAPEEDDMIANQNIASGVYFMIGNNLYLSTASILAGDPIKPGTNCTATNLAAALNALNS